MKLPPDAVTALAATVVAGLMMIRTGLDRRMLALRQPVRRCGGCGRRLVPGTAHHCH